MQLTTEQFVAMMNRITNQSDPRERVELAVELARGLRAVLGCPPSVMESLVDKLDLECERVEARVKTGVQNETLKAIFCAGIEDSRETTRLLRAFLAVRESLVEAVKHGGEA